MMFQKAARKRAYLKMALTGPSGSGKTMSALRMARGLVGPEGRIAVLDTENESASLYSDRVEFDTAPISSPFTVVRYTDVINGAVQAGYSVLIIDSLTHAWAGEGGLLSQKEALDARGGNSFTNWAGITKQQEAFKAAILQAPIHIIATMRSKQEYVVEQGSGGKSAPKKVGMAPIQRDGMEYEFTTVLDLGMGHEAVASKDRTGLFDGVVGLLTEDSGKRLRVWLESGQAEDDIAASPAGRPGPAPRSDQAPAARQQTPAPSSARTVRNGEYDPTGAEVRNGGGVSRSARPNERSQHPPQSRPPTQETGSPLRPNVSSAPTPPAPLTPSDKERIAAGLAFGEAAAHLGFDTLHPDHSVSGPKTAALLRKMLTYSGLEGDGVITAEDFQKMADFLPEYARNRPPASDTAVEPWPEDARNFVSAEEDPAEVGSVNGGDEGDEIDDPFDLPPFDEPSPADRTLADVQTRYSGPRARR